MWLLTANTTGSWTNSTSITGSVIKMADILIKIFPTGLDGRWESFEHIVIHGDGSITDHLGMNIGKARLLQFGDARIVATTTTV